MAGRKGDEGRIAETHLKTLRASEHETCANRTGLTQDRRTQRNAYHDKAFEKKQLKTKIWRFCEKRQNCRGKI
jgi:hypothetical protein